ncbi:MAG: hypothetical protein WDO13_04025 [Verrucomicrobiota bacterium]
MITALIVLGGSILACWIGSSLPDYDSLAPRIVIIVMVLHDRHCQQ